MLTSIKLSPYLEKIQANNKGKKTVSKPKESLGGIVRKPK